MNKGKYVFSQLLSFLDPFVFLRISKKYGGDKYVKTFSCWNQLAVMMFGQLSNRESLRDLVLATHAHANKAFHLGFGKHASKSTLADANANRDYRIFEEFAYRVMAEARQCRATEIFKLGGKAYAFDSSTIDLCLSVFSWALFRKKKGGIKLPYNTGQMASYFLPGRRIMLFYILIGLIGAIAGGWGSAITIGDHTPQTFATAALVALFIAGAALWIYNPILTRLIGRK